MASATRCSIRWRASVGSLGLFASRAKETARKVGRIRPCAFDDVEGFDFRLSA